LKQTRQSAVLTEGKLAWLWPVAACKWCGELAEAIGVYMDLGAHQVVVAYSCAKHTENLAALIDGLSEGDLTAVATKDAPQREEMH
jgi:hypothetical protein